MTITIAWERRLRGRSEIVFCSDSRLTGGGNIDVCQKVFPLPREDAAIGFCGSTLIAYPIIHQFISYVRHHKQNLDRALDGSVLPGRFATLANKFLDSYIDSVDLQAELRETTFIIGAFSLSNLRPIINQIRYDGGSRNYVAASSKFPETRSPLLNKHGRFGMIGDLSSQYFDILSEEIDYGQAVRFDMEPFSALSKMLGDPTFTDRRSDLRGPIGGAPQLLKIYQFLRTLEFGVYWPNRVDGKLYLNGREVFDYEKLLIPQIDCATRNVFYPLGELDPAGL